MPRGNGGIVEKKVSKKQKSDEWIICIHRFFCLEIVSDFIDLIILFLTAPAGKLYFMRPAEAFFIYFKVAVMTGAIFSSPILFYQFWAFLVPAFTRREKTALSMLVPASLGLFMIGIAFSYFFVLPQGLKFFMSFTNDVVQSMWSMESYLDFVMMLVVPFGFIFDFPLLLLVLALVLSHRYNYVGCANVFIF